VKLSWTTLEGKAQDPIKCFISSVAYVPLGDLQAERENVIQQAAMHISSKSV